MIKKLQLQAIISKYHLGGLIEGVKWSIEDNQLNIKFASPNKDMLGELNINDFQLENAEVAIFNTSQLNKLLNITSGELMVSFTKSNKIFTKLIIDDNQYTVSYSLADLMLIEKPAKVNDYEFEIEVPLDKEIINALIKAKNALPDVESVILRSFDGFDGTKEMEVLFGDDKDYSNKISYFIKNVITENKELYQLCFDSNVFKEILSSNKDCENGKMFINLEGLLKLEFQEEQIKSEYYLVKKENY